ncbi:hypothetical protein Tco_0549337 [Tanacetum coccineum]
MDDPNITIEEYIRLEEEKACRHGKVFNWETAKLTSEDALSCESTVSSINGNKINFRISLDESEDEDCTPTVSCIDDLDFFKEFENEFPAIVYNDALTSKSDFLTEPTLSPQHIDKFDLKDEPSLSEYDEEEQNVLDQRHQYLRFEGLQYTDADIAALEMRLARIYKRKDAMEYRDTEGQSLFTSQAWRRLFDIRDPLVHELILEFFSTFRFRESVLDLDTTRALQFQLGGARHHIRISFAGDFLAKWHCRLPILLIWILMLRLCHRLIACSIAGRSQTHEKGAHEAAEDAPAVDEGAQAILAPMQAPQPPPPPPAVGRTMPQRLGRLEEDEQGLR